MDFGISLDPLAVPQRHTLYDSESDEEDEQHQNRIDQLRSVFTVDKREKSEVLTGKSLLVGIGTTAAVFVRSFLHLRKEPSFSVKGDTGSVLAGKHFPMGKDKEDVTVVYEVEGAAGKWVVCVHEGELRVEYSNFWTEKVFGQGEPDEVIVLVCRPLHEYSNPSASHDEDYTHIVRELQNSLWSHPPINEVLQAPNSLQGELAAILTHCELQSIPAAVHILYSSSSQTETERALSLYPTLQHLATPRGLPINDEEEGELMVKKLLPKPRTDLATLYT